MMGVSRQSLTRHSRTMRWRDGGVFYYGKNGRERKRTELASRPTADKAMRPIIRLSRHSLPWSFR